MEKRLYSSSVQPGLKLSAEFYVPPEPRPLCLFFHGWHMTAAQSSNAGYMEKLCPYFFVVNVDMRGRGASSGKPDANGFELLDALDAMDFARRTWPGSVDNRVAPKLVGGSGGGGNVLAMLGKAPDIFSAGATWAAITDYAARYEFDKKGTVRDEMEGKGWIGGSPATNPAGYFARGGINLLENEVVPLLVIHGRRDMEVPDIQAEQYMARAVALGRQHVRFIFNNLGHESVQWPEIIAHLRANNNLPQWPQEVGLRVHGFLACRAFWLMLDDPARMGMVNYRCDAAGRLAELRFTPDAAAAPRAFVLRLFQKPVSLILTRQSNESFLTSVASKDKYADYRWEGQGAWQIIVRQTD